MNMRTPQPVAYCEGEMALAGALNIPNEQLRTIKRCPDCEGYIIPCDNGIWLDAGRAPEKAVVIMGIVELAGMMLAASPAQGEASSRHTVHEHQPDEVFFT